MTVKDARTGLTWIDRTDCLRLLKDDVVGRLAVVHGSTPSIFPLNYVVDGEDLVFRTDPGTKLDSASRGQAACFEIDCIDRETRTGWSVIATGRLEEITDYDLGAWREAHQLGVDPWAKGPKVHWLRLVTSRITGRRIE